MRSLSFLGALALLAGCDGFRTHDSEYDIPTSPYVAPSPSTPSTIQPVKTPRPPSPGYTYDPYASTTSTTAYLAIDVADRYSCALRETNQVDCWGDVLAGAPPLLDEISTSAKTACGVNPNGAIVCWGATGGFDAPSGEKLTHVRVGDGFACALDPQRHPHCWGPNAITPPADVVLQELAVGADHACGLDDRGLPVCWGEADTPPRLPYFEIAAGPHTTCALRSGTHSVHCWGLLAGIMPSTGGFKHVAVTEGKACGIRDSDDRVECWGLERAANGQTVDELAPPPSVPFTSLALGTSHACGLRRDNGLALCWGRNTAGESRPPF